MQRHRGQYIVPGPNFIWSIDGYDKLKPYGIEIYACIDGYSRYVVWIYIGISNSTAVSCLCQFLDCLNHTKRQPRFKPAAPNDVQSVTRVEMRLLISQDSLTKVIMTRV
jgi:hypothetical protein